MISDRVLKPCTTMFVIGALITTSALLLAASLPEWPLVAVVAVAIVFGASAAGFIPVVLGEITRRATADDVGALTSGANLFVLGGIVPGSLAFGAIASVSSYQTAFVAMAACTLLASIIAIVRRRPQ